MADPDSLLGTLDEFIMGRWFLSTLFSSRYKWVRLVDKPTTPSTVSMVTRLLVEQVRTSCCRVRGDDNALVGAIIRGAEDCARMRQGSGQQAIVPSLLQRHISTLISATMASFPIDRVLALLTGISELGSRSPLRETPNNSCQVALVAAATVGDVQELKFLIEERGADVNGMTMFFGMPLHAAASGGHISAMEFLLENGADPHTKDLQEQRSALDYAAMSGHTAAAALLLSVGADPDALNSALFHAVSQGHAGVTALLLARESVDVNVHDYSSNALTFAIKRNHVDVVKQLIQKPGLEVNGVDDNYGAAPLAMAAEYGRASVLELLLSRPDIEVNQAAGHMPPPMAVACEAGQLNVVKILLASGKADINIRSGSGFTPLISAASAGYADVVKVLLACDNIDVNARTTEWPGWDGWSALSKAVENGDEEVVHLLLEDPRVQVDSREGGGHTPLSMTANGHDGGQITEMLLARGVDAKLPG
jgi:ankyrin repeat protein